MSDLTVNNYLTKNQRDALIRWAQKYVGRKNFVFIWSEQAAPRPKRSYGTLRFLTGPIKNGYDEERICDDGSIIYSGERQFTLSINIYGTGALNLMANLQDSIEWNSVREHFRIHELATLEDLGIQNLTELIESEYEERAQMDIIFNNASNVRDTEEDPGIIEKVEMEGTHEGGKDEHIYQVNVDSTS